jgi:peroxiredoxin
MVDFTTLPDDLPVPVDDGAAEHLPGAALPALTLPSTTGEQVDLGTLGTGRTIIYLYPMTGRPGTELPTGWDDIPGARGCTTEACDFRDHFQLLRAAGATMTERLQLPFPVLSDPGFLLGTGLNLPTFTTSGERLYKRLTLVVRDGVIEHVFYPVFPPNTHAQQVLDWLGAHPA